MNLSNWSRLGVIAISILTTYVNCIPKYDDGGFIPSSVSYFEKVGEVHDQLAMPSQIEKQSELPLKRRGTDNNDIADRNQEARFGFTNVGTTGSGYAVAPYAPAKIDLGGLLLGAIIGVGSILIIPKLLYVLSGTYGAYARSEENNFAQSMTRLDDILARHGIDTTSCMQRIICTYSQQAVLTTHDTNAASKEENALSFDRMINAITTNQIFKTATEGTAVQEAVETGRAGRDCSRAYPHCEYSMETMLSLLSNIITAATSTNLQVASPIGTSSL